jgi:hypothetical protein
MKPFPPLLLLAVMAMVFLGIPIGLYVLLTRGQRRATREIKRGASERGWRYRVRHWQGDPTSFRIDGRTAAGLTWILKSTGTSGYNRGWTVVLGLHVPILGGEMDFAVLPRDPKDPNFAALALAVSPGAMAKIADFSSAGASAIEFLRDARETPAGLAAFDAAYQVITLPEKFRQPLVNPALAERVLHWPDSAVRPHSLLAWRDPFGVQFQARLPGPPNWVTVSYFLALAEDFCAQVPPPAVPAIPRTFLDRLIARVQGE